MHMQCALINPYAHSIQGTLKIQTPNSELEAQGNYTIHMFKYTLYFANVKPSRMYNVSTMEMKE